jgi:hypothetical protein
MDSKKSGSGIEERKLLSIISRLNLVCVTLSKSFKICAYITTAFKLCSIDPCVAVIIA